MHVMRHMIRVVVAMALPLAASGCNLLGFAANAVGPPPVQPQYVPRKEPILVLCENYKDPGATYLESEQLERLVAHELVANDVAPPVGADTLAQLRGDRAAEFARMSITQIGRATGAMQVLYIHMERTSTDVAEASEMLKGSGAARAKLIDVATGATLWPTDTPEGRYVSAESPMLHAGETTTPQSVRAGVQRELAEKIVQFFYSYKPE